jgi:hypothetical protein
MSLSRKLDALKIIIIIYLVDVYGMIIFHGFKVLGDSAYPNNDVNVSIYKVVHLPSASVAFDTVMCLIWTGVKWGYELIVRYWVFLNFKKQKKIQQSAIVPMGHLAIFPTKFFILHQWHRCPSFLFY